MSPRSRAVLVGIVLVAVIVALTALALSVGAAETTSQIVGTIRAPRVVMAIVVGIGLGVAGALMQGSLGNPLADPALVGVSAGAALGCVAAASAGVAFGTFAAAGAATLGGLIALVVVVLAAVTDRRPEVVTLLLAGVAVAAFAGALLTVIVSLSPSAAVRSVSFWAGGSLALSTWAGVLAVLPFVALGLVLAAVVARPLDVLSLGDRGARSVGIDVTRVRYLALAGVVLLVGAGVGAVGIIAFVGLLVPHAMRGLVGPRHGSLLVLSGLAGAALLLAADTIARIAANPIEMPIGAITAAIGAPAFFVLLRRTRSRQGGWA